MRASTILMSLHWRSFRWHPLHAQEVRTGADAFGTWEGDAPGVSRHIRPADLPPPTHHENDPEAPDFEQDAEGCRSTARQDAGCAGGLRGAGVRQRPEPASRHPDRPERRHLRGGKRERTRSGLPRRRRRRRAGDARGLRREPGAALRHRVPSAERPAARLCGRCEPGRPLPVPQAGDRKASGPAEVIIPDIPTSRHWTRDLEVSRDGERLFVSIGSASNVAAAMPEKTPEEIQGP